MYSSRRPPLPLGRREHFMQTEKSVSRVHPSLRSIDLFHSINKILCPIDLSTESSKALGYAIALARTFDAKLYVCYSVESAKSSGTGYIRNLISESISQHAHPLNMASLAWRSLILEGNAASSILDASIERKIDLIVMHSRRRPYAAALLGSTAESICRVSPCPILVVHSDERDWVEESKGEIAIDNVLVACDYSPYSKLALSYAYSLSKRYEANLHLLNVLPFGLGNMWVPPTDEKKKEAVYRLRNELPSQAYSKCSIQTDVRVGQPYGSILQYVKEADIDLICMGAHGKSSGEGLFGSNTDRVLREAPCPVLIARSPTNKR
jgi:nucleotide-binding universal stress UspA family protein